MIKFNDYRIQKISRIKLGDIILDYDTRGYYSKDKENSLYAQDYMRQDLEDLNTYLRENMYNDQDYMKQALEDLNIYLRENMNNYRFGYNY